MFENLLGNDLTLVAGTWCNHCVVCVLINCHEPPLSVSTHVYHTSPRTAFHGSVLRLSGCEMVCDCRGDSSFRMLHNANISPPSVPHECLLRPSTWSDRRWWMSKIHVRTYFTYISDVIDVLGEVHHLLEALMDHVAVI